MDNWTCLFTAACAVFGRVCPTAAYAACQRVCPKAAFAVSGCIFVLQQQTLLPLDVSVLQQYMLLLDVSVLQQSVLLLDVSVLQPPEVPYKRICYTAVCDVPGRVCESFLQQSVLCSVPGGVACVSPGCICSKAVSAMPGSIHISYSSL
jgi:hypothetical protein